MINATEMAKPFKKLVADFLRLKGTKSYIYALETRYGNSHNVKREVLRVIQGGANPETNTMCSSRLSTVIIGGLRIMVEDKKNEVSDVITYNPLLLLIIYSC